MGALVTFLVLAMIGAVVYVIWSKTGTTVSVMTSLGKDDLKDSITNFLTQRKYLQVSRSENLMTFAMDQKASCIIALLLFMIGFIPGLLYLFLGGKTKTLTVQFDTLQGQHGSNVRIQGQRSIVNRIRKVVGIPQGALSPNVAPAGHPAISPAPGVAVPAYQPQALPVAAPMAAAPEVSVDQPRRVQASPDRSASSVDRHCPRCDSIVLAGLRFCRYCGTEVL